MVTENAPDGREPLQIEADVLIVGGGMAACWAGIAAARTGAKVVLVDKGYVGTSGVTATAGPGHWWVSPEGNARKEAIDKRLSIAHGLGEPSWMERIIDTTWRVLPTLAKYYRFNVKDDGKIAYNGETEVVASGLLGQFRRDSGWDEWQNDPRHENQIWQLGPYIQAGGKRSVERVQKRIAEREILAASSGEAAPEQAE